MTASPNAGSEISVRCPNGHVPRGKFVELIPDRRVVFTWGYDQPANGMAPGSSAATIELSGICNWYAADASARRDSKRTKLRGSPRSRNAGNPTRPSAMRWGVARAAKNFRDSSATRIAWVKRTRLRFEWRLFVAEHLYSTDDTFGQLSLDGRFASTAAFENPPRA